MLNIGWLRRFRYAPISNMTAVICDKERSCWRQNCDSNYDDNDDSICCLSDDKDARGIFCFVSRVATRLSLSSVFHSLVSKWEGGLMKIRNHHQNHRQLMSKTSAVLVNDTALSLTVSIHI